MPLYEFRCLQCKQKFSLRISVSEYIGKKYKCPKCKSRKVEKLISSINVVTSKKS